MKAFTNEYFMQQALKEARKAFDEEEVPVGAIVVADNQIIGKGYNQTRRLKDATAHAEILAITAASNYLATPILDECVLYVTVEPCLMCFGAIENSRISKIVFGCHEPKTGYNLRISAKENLEVIAGVMAEDAKSLMKEFFVNRR